MQKWEYIGAILETNHEQNQLYAKIGDTVIVGMKAVLDEYGKAGWELVSFNPEVIINSQRGASTWQQAQVFRAVFKRPLQDK
jgi:hypothetical protein